MTKKKQSHSGTSLLLCILLDAALLIFLLVFMAGGSEKAARSDLGRVNMSRQDTQLQADLSALIAGPDASVRPAEPAEAAPQLYTISDDALVAPVPRRSGYGSGQPSSAAVVVADASQTLAIDNLFFSENVSLAPGTSVRWYSDETILALCWTEVVNETLYTYSEVIVGDASQFRRFLSGGEFGSGQLALTTEMSATVNAVVAASGDFYAYRGTVISVHDGEVKRANSGWLDVCMVDYDGDLHMIPRSELNERPDLEEYIRNYVKENNIRFCMEFGPILYDHGPVEIEWGYPAGACGKGRARSAICQLGKLHYLVVDANIDEYTYQHEPNIFEFQEMIEKTGCIAAFALDGGQTASVAMDNKLVNHVSYGSPRAISDILYFATALPSGG